MATQEEYQKYIKTNKDALPCYVCRNPLDLTNSKVKTEFVTIQQYTSIDAGLLQKTKMVIHKDCFIQTAGRDYYFES